MKLLREQDEAEWAKLVEECDHSDDDDEEEENFAWYNMEDADTYFTLTTATKHTFKKNDQLFICYGRTSNQYLLNNYGFSLANNKYNSLRFRVNLDFGWKDKMDGKAPESPEEMKVSKMIKLKEFRLRDEVFAYTRANLMNQ